MNTKIEFHMIQSFPPSNLNRDESNMPKDTVFGGVRRARISSQCLKRAIRLSEHFSEQTQLSPSARTRKLKLLLVEKLNQIKPSEDNQKLAEDFTVKLLGNMDKKNPNLSNVLFFVSEEEIEKISQSLLKNEKIDDVVDEYKREFSKRTSAPDIALFGRMLAADPKLNVNAACQVAHAISTHKVDMDLDFFIAAESIMDSEDAETMNLGAAMMGVTGYNSSCFYRYAAIDWGQLIVNLAGDQELAINTAKGFMQAMAYALPTGKQTSFAANTMPYFMMAVIRNDGQAWSLVNSFEQPVYSKKGLQKESLEKLISHWNRLNKVYSIPNKEPKAFSLLLEDDPEVKLPGLTCETINDWITRVSESIRE
jgi:CRISPR system Cascade subunit CasC